MGAGDELPGWNELERDAFSDSIQAAALSLFQWIALVSKQWLPLGRDILERGRRDPASDRRACLEIGNEVFRLAQNRLSACRECAQKGPVPPKKDQPLKTGSR